MELATGMVDEAGIHDQAAVFYAFHREDVGSCKDIGFENDRGLGYYQSFPEQVPITASDSRAAPEFIANSFRRLLRSQKTIGRANDALCGRLF